LEARDIQRYLADEVVEARPPSVGYRVSKFVRRHKGQVLAASLVLLALVGGIVGTTLGLFEARRQEQIARDETVEKEKARLAEALRVKERDDALKLEALRVKERDAALGKADAALDEANHRLDSSNFLLAVAAYDNRDVLLARLRLDSIQAKHRGWEWHYVHRQCLGGIFTLYGHTGKVKCVAFSLDGTRIVTGSSDSTAKAWEARTGTPQLQLKGHTSPVWSVAFSPDGTRIVTGPGVINGPGEAKVWDAQTGTPLLELKGHTSGVTSVAFSPDGTRLVTGSDDKTAKVWDARTSTPQLELKGHTHWVSSVAFSPDGTRLVTGSGDRTAKVWDARTGTPLLGLKGHTDRVESVAFSPDGTRIVTGSFDQTGKVWEARTGSPQLQLKGHTGQVLSVAFSPDGTRIVTGSSDKTAKVWEAQTGTPQLELKGHTSRVRIVAFSSDGTRIVTRSDDQTAKVWDAQTGQELKGEPIPPTITNRWISPDGRLFAHAYDSLVELVPLQPDEEELSYRLVHTQPNLWRYREGYEAARAAQDDFAARFYLNLLPLPEQNIFKAQAAADQEIAAGRTPDALVYLVMVAAASADDTSLALRLAYLQAWFGQDKELADTCGRALESAKSTFDPVKWGHLARVCSLRPTLDPTRLQTALALARKAEELRKKDFNLQLTVGMAEYGSGHFLQADAALSAAATGAKYNPQVAGTATFYRAMSLFRQGKEDEARKLASGAAAQMKPLPKEEKNPLAGGASLDDLLLWLAYKEAKDLIKFEPAPAAP
jgi:WD40 repeat protein